MSLCEAMIIGNVGSEPELRYTAQGREFCSFSVACNRKYKKDGATVEATEWFRCTAWGGLATTCSEYLEKGRKVFLQGRLSTDTYEKKDGTGPAFSLRLDVTTMDLGMGGGERREGPAPAVVPADDDSLPF